MRPFLVPIVRGVVATLGAAATLLSAAVTAAPSRAAPAGDPVAKAASRALATFRATLRADDGLHAQAIRGITADMKRGRASLADAFDTHASAISFLAEKSDAAADLAAAAFLADASAAMTGVAQPGAVPGDGGALDTFESALRKELERVRGRARGRTLTFGRTFVRLGGGTTMLRTSLPPWEFSIPGAPSPAGPIAAGDEVPRLRVITAARLPDGNLRVCVAGTSGAGFEGAFDVRMRGANEQVLPPKLSDGGVQVGETGYWRIGPIQIGDAFRASTPLAGNRVLQFGIEPYDAGPAGLQPGRHLHAGVFGLP